MTTSLIKDKIIDLKISRTQLGGSDDINKSIFDILTKINNTKFNYLASISTSSTPQQYVFEYVDTVKTKSYNNNFVESKVLASGSFTAVFNVKVPDSETNRILRNTNLILRMTNFDNNLDKTVNTELIKFIDKWRENKINYNEKMIDIYLYGNILDENCNRICQYMLTKRYNTFDDYNTIKTLSKNEKINMIMDILDFCSKLQKQGKFWRDIKVPNIGYDENKKVVLIDYDNYTIIDQNDDEFMNHCISKMNTICLGYASGTYVPKYAFVAVEGEDGKNMSSNDLLRQKMIELYKNKKLDKLMTVGLVEIIVTLIKNDFNSYRDTFDKFIYMHYQSFDPVDWEYRKKHILVSNDKYTSIVKFIMKQSDYQEYAPITMIIKMLLGAYDITQKHVEYDNYDLIPKYEDILNFMKNAYHVNQIGQMNQSGGSHVQEFQSKYKKYLEKNKSLMALLNKHKIIY